jgi:hypothetical protein
LIDDQKKIKDKKKPHDYTELNKTVKKNAKLDKNMRLRKRYKEIHSNFNGEKAREAYKLRKQLNGRFRAATRAAKDISNKLLLEDKQLVKAGQSIKRNCKRIIIHMKKEY